MGMGQNLLSTPQKRALLDIRKVQAMLSFNVFSLQKQKTMIHIHFINIQHVITYTYYIVTYIFIYIFIIFYMYIHIIHINKYINRIRV